MTIEEKRYVLQNMLTPLELVKAFEELDINHILNKRHVGISKGSLPHRYHIYAEYTQCVHTIDTSEHPEWEEFLESSLKK